MVVSVVLVVMLLSRLRGVASFSVGRQPGTVVNSRGVAASLAEKHDPLFLYPSHESSDGSVSAPNGSYDVIVVGSGIGGLSCAAMLSLYGYSVAVFESHYAPGGAAHGFSVRQKDIDGYFHFDTGPSFFSGLNPNIAAKTSNPLRVILDAIGETVECIPYESFGLKFPEGDFLHTTNFGGKGGVLDEVSGLAAVQQWNKLMKDMEPLAGAVAAMPTAALRGDIGALLTAGQVSAGRKTSDILVSFSLVHSSLLSALSLFIEIILA